MYDVGLGNRDEFRAANTVAETGERITICPVSSDGSDNKILLALHCKKNAATQKCNRPGNFYSRGQITGTQAQSGNNEWCRCTEDLLRWWKSDNESGCHYIWRGLALNLYLDICMTKHDL